MSSNEIPSTPALITKTIDMQAASTPMAEELTYTYQRADGTVERARNAKDAIDRCPVLGKIAIEAPDQANMLLELAAVGNAKMAAEVKIEPKKPAQQVAHSAHKPAKAVETEKLALQSSPVQIAQAEVSVIVSGPVAPKQPLIKADNTYSTRLESPRQYTSRAFENAAEPVTGVEIVTDKPNVEASKENNAFLILPVTNNVKADKSPAPSKNDSVDPSPLINSGAEQRRQQNTETQKKVYEHVHLETTEYMIAPADQETVALEDPALIMYGSHAIDGEPDEPIERPKELIDTLDVEFETTDIETVLEIDDLEARDHTVDMDSESSVEFLNYPLGASTYENVELLFEPETIETYTELKDLIAEQVASEVVPIEITLESTKAIPSEQPVGQTFVQIVEHIADSAEDNKRLEPLVAIVKDAEKYLSIRYSKYEAFKTKVQITPEMSDKLLILLLGMGCQNPKEVLAYMVHRHGHASVLHSLMYLFSLADENNRRELLSNAAPTLISNDTPLVTLSKLILKVVMGKEHLPDAIVA